MQVIATAGHVDHGKSALVRALTGMEPDRWAEERRRGLTIDLGYAWFTVPSGEQVAFVDVPGHERFVQNMLAGVGPVPAVMFVVAADGGWMPQSQEHLAAIDALGIRHGLLVVTRADLADPGPALREAARRIAATTLGEVEACAVSAVTGQGLADLAAALDRLVGGLPPPDPRAPVRLWVDRSFSIRGSGTVVTGTLPAGSISVHDELLVTPSGRRARVRGLQSLRENAKRVSGVARVAVNLRGVEAGSVTRGMALVQPGGWTLTTMVDVRVALPAAGERRGAGVVPGASGPAPGAGSGQRAAEEPPRELSLHIGAARTTVRVRMLGGAIARLTLRDPLPLHVGDRVLLRTPGLLWRVAAESTGRSRWPALAGATVLDVSPPSFRGRGAAAKAGRELAGWPGRPTAADLLRRHGLLRLPALRATGVTGHPEPVAGDWLADPGHWAALSKRLQTVVAEYMGEHALAAGMPIEAARAALGLPDRRLVEPLAPPEVSFADGVLVPGQAGRPARPAAQLPESVMSAVRAVLADLADEPFAAPDADRLRELGLDSRAIAAAGRARALLRVSDQVVLAPGADAEAARVLAGLPQPFTTADARKALGTSRRVAIPLLEYLDRAGVTHRLPDDRRELTPR